MSGIVPVHGNMSTPSETAHLQLQTDAICGKFDIHITVLTIEVYSTYTMQGKFTLLPPATVSTVETVKAA